MECTWQCSICTFDNEISVEFCEACDHKKDDSVCKSDVSKRNENSTSSTAGKKFRTESPTDSVVIPAEDVLTIHDDEDDNYKQNINGKLVIDVDSGDEDVSSDSATQNSSKWKCQRCTLLNSSHAHRCQVCDSPRKTRLPTLSDVDPTYEAPSLPDVNGTSVNGTSVNGTSASTSTAETSSKIPKKILSSMKSFFEKSIESIKSQPSQQDGFTDSEPIEILDEWRCSACTFGCNPSWVTKCQSCGANNTSNQPSSPIEIDNDKVTYVRRTNSNSVIQNQSKRKSPSDGWVCHQCTFINSDLTLKSCTMCNAIRSDLAGWQCQKCTLVNQPESTICSACKETRKTSLHDFAAASENQAQMKTKVMAIPPNSSPPLHRQESSLAECIRQIEEREACELRQHIVMQCKSTREPFVDDSFPPCGKSLHINPQQPFSSVKIQWCRPSAIAVTDFHEARLPWVVCRTPLPVDISQGVLGNCWFLSSLAVVAERRRLVENIILTDTLCAEGIYQVRLCKDGTWRTVIIDDLLPCDQNKNLIFSKARRKQLWVPLIEKAMAKLHGSYEALVAGKCIEGLSALTGAPCESIALQNDENKGVEICPDMVWAKLLSCRDMRFLMGASCGGGNMKVNGETFHQVGLRARHAYSILDIQDVEGHKLIQLRNPWGCFSWTGKWSDGSPAWDSVSVAARHRLMADGQEQGVFWMEFEDLIRYFDNVDVCKIRSDWHETRVIGTFPNSCRDVSPVIKLTVFCPTEVELGLFQEGSRGSNQMKSPIDLCVLTTKESSNPSQVSVGKLVAHSMRDLHHFVGCSHMLEAGEYLVIPVAFQHWNGGIVGGASMNQEQHKFVLSVHSSKKLMLEDNLLGRPFVLADSLIQLAVSKGSREELREGVTAYTLMSGWSGSILVVENRLPYQVAYIEVDCSKSSNIVSTRGTLHTKDEVLPHHRQVIMVLSHLERRQPYHLLRRLIHRLNTVPRLSRGPFASFQKPPFHEPPILPEVATLHAPRPYI